MKPLFVLMLTFGVLAAPAYAQFKGPSAAGQASTVVAVSNARLGSYVTVTGNIVTHLRSDYFTFRDDTGEIRVEIGANVFQGREVTPETKVRLTAEVDRSLSGRYLWVKSLDLVE